uniref:Uncharacterized protein n=1 Tax=Oryza nivara TaxID=4536 RepID=A0A0E0FJN8_ORYNI
MTMSHMDVQLAYSLLLYLLLEKVKTTSAAAPHFARSLWLDPSVHPLLAARHVSPGRAPRPRGGGGGGNLGGTDWKSAKWATGPTPPVPTPHGPVGPTRQPHADPQVARVKQTTQPGPRFI